MKNYRADIDGLRALAVGVVVLYHAGLGCPGGFVGVDVFFVISGYLITQVLLNELRAGRFTMGSFLARRIRRLLPALTVVLLFVAGLSWFLLFPEHYLDVGRNLVAQPLFMTNVVFWRTLQFGYFGSNSLNLPLLHTWSLAVEEQFYLLYPLALAFGFKRVRAARQTWCLTTVALVSAALSVWMTPIKPVPAYFLLPTRAFELLFGAIAAVTPLSSRNLRDQFLSLLGLVLILTAVFAYDESTVFPGAAALVPTLGTALLIACNDVSETWTQRLFSARPLVFIGLISYSLYLWHWPLIAFAKYNQVWSRPIALGVVLVSVVAATLSWRFVERPFRQKSLLKTNGQAFLFAFSVSLPTIFLGLAIVKTGGFPQRVPEKARGFSNVEKDLGNFSHQMTPADIQDGRLTRFGAQGAATVIVWGDSHAMGILPAVEEVCKAHGVAGEAATRTATPPLFCEEPGAPDSQKRMLRDWSQAFFAHIRQSRIRKVILICRWDRYQNFPGFAEGLDETYRQLLDSSVDAYFLRQVPVYEKSVPRALALQQWHGGELFEFRKTTEEYLRERGPVDQLMMRLKSPRIHFLDPLPLLTDGRYCRVVSGNQCIYRDENHLSANGSRILRPLFESIFNS